MKVHRPVHANVHSAPFSTAPGPGIPEMMSHRREVLLEQVKLSRTVMLLSESALRRSERTRNRKPGAAGNQDADSGQILAPLDM
jgi:hypothetical protein